MPINSACQDLRMDQVAHELGVHRNTVKTLLLQGAFPTAYRLLRQWRIPRADVDAFKAARRIGGAK